MLYIQISLKRGWFIIFCWTFLSWVSFFHLHSINCRVSVVLWQHVANYFASQARDPGIDSHQHQKDSWHVWRHLRKDTVFSCNLHCRLTFLHGRSRTYRVASLRAGPVGRISYNLYFNGQHVQYVTCGFNKWIYTRFHCHPCIVARTAEPDHFIWRFYCI